MAATKQQETRADEEALAEAVGRYPVLYDKSMKEFKDQNTKEIAWKKVADVVSVLFRLASHEFKLDQIIGVYL